MELRGQVWTLLSSRTESFPDRLGCASGFEARLSASPVELEVRQPRPVSATAFSWRLIC